MFIFILVPMHRDRDPRLPDSDSPRESDIGAFLKVFQVAMVQNKRGFYNTNHFLIIIYMPHFMRYYDNSLTHILILP
jgi:hypothetical protein